MSEQALSEIVEKLNKTLQSWSDKDWNYSRIYLQSSRLDDIDGAYALWPELIDMGTKEGRSDSKASAQEVAWGERHANELGILEIVNLRVNTALMEIATDEQWGTKRPIVRVVKKEHLVQQGITHAIWYRVNEVVGEDFDSR